MKSTMMMLAPLAAVALVLSGLRADDKDKPKPADKPGFIGIQIKAEGDAKGATVQSVIDDGPAAKAGLKPEDVILKINGKEFESLEEFVKLVRANKPGDTVTLSIKRDGKDMEIKIKATVAPEPKEP